jgi:ATP-dependent Lon protease
LTKPAVPLELPKGQLYPVLPLRDIVVFPFMAVPLFVGRERSVRALESVVKVDQKILLVAQKDSSKEDPRIRDLYGYGTIAHVVQLLKLPDGTIKVLVEGLERGKILRVEERDGFFEAYAEAHVPVDEDPIELEALSRTSVTLFEQYLKLNTKIPPDVLASIGRIEEAQKLADTLAAHLAIKMSDKQILLEIDTVVGRLEKICSFMEGEIGILQTEKRIRSRVKRQMEKSQRDYYLNEQMKAIQKELGDPEDGRGEIADLEEKLNRLKLPKETKAKALSELKKLRTMSPMSSEATVVRNYLDWIVGLPWKKLSKIKKDIQGAEDILNEDHYGLEKVKERILEYLAVQSRVGQVKGAILCLVGPPGVGKTSLGRSIARATGREFVRISLGGVRDEAEIRGHRRTYIGSMPGKIIQSMKKAGTSNPLFLLDEIDKLGADWRGDPSAALLEVLDPEQNSTFNDHYLEVDYDLSEVMFVTTANSLDMPRPLLDRMEVIRLAGYTEDEKLEICRRHLIAKELKAHGLKDDEWSITDEALRDLIRLHTREAGVRHLERELANLMRKGIKKILTKTTDQIAITTDNLKEYAGTPRFHYGVTENEDYIGVTTGLAWTEVGGDILHIEAVMLPGRGKMMITGKLGEVMQESVQAAASFVRARATSYGIEPPIFEKNDIHVHVPDGATPKDGPSAGVAMCTSIVSVLTGIPIRRDVAMTGEITLRGRVLMIGGLKEKLLAAQRGGIKTVLIPDENEKDLDDIPDTVKKGITIIPVKTIDDVLRVALVRAPSPIIWTPLDQPVSPSPSTLDDDDVIGHGFMPKKK